MIRLVKLITRSDKFSPPRVLSDFGVTQGLLVNFYTAFGPGNVHLMSHRSGVDSVVNNLFNQIDHCPSF